MPMTTKSLEQSPSHSKMRPEYGAGTTWSDMSWSSNADMCEKALKALSTTKQNIPKVRNCKTKSHIHCEKDIVSIISHGATYRRAVKRRKLLRKKLKTEPWNQKSIKKD